MGKEEFKKKLLESKIFKEQKDSYIKNIDSLRKKYKNSDVDFTDLYRKITNYQIKKYGTSLHSYIEIRTPEICKRRALYSNQRRYHRRKRGEK